MCGRYDLSRNAHEVLTYFGIEGAREWPPHYNIAPGQPILTIHADAGGDPVAAWSHWGFRPRFAEDKPSAPAPINARAETVATSGYFRNSFARRRAIVPADGWYEWQEAPGQRQPWRFTRADGGLILLAAIWTPTADGSGERCAIITEPARGFASRFHPRMPVVLADECWRDWLDPERTDRDSIRESTDHLPMQALQAYPVSSRVGNPRNDDAALLEPVGDAVSGS